MNKNSIQHSIQPVGKFFTERELERRLATAQNVALTYGQAHDVINSAVYKLSGALGEIMVAAIHAARLPETQRAEALKLTVPSAQTIFYLAHSLDLAVQDWARIIDELRPEAFRRDGLQSLVRLAVAVAKGLHALEEHDDPEPLLSVEGGPMRFREALQTARHNPIPFGRPRDRVNEFIRSLAQEHSAVYGRGPKLQRHLTQLLLTRPERSALENEALHALQQHNYHWFKRVIKKMGP